MALMDTKNTSIEEKNDLMRLIIVKVSYGGVKQTIVSHIEL